jgi:hypothetical protein
VNEQGPGDQDANGLGNHDKISDFSC